MSNPLNITLSETDAQHEKTDLLGFLSSEKNQ